MLDLWIMAPSPARRDWLLKCVNTDPEIHVVGIAATFPVLRSMMSDIPADISLIDLPAELKDSVMRDWLREVLDLTPVVLLSQEPDAAILKEVRRAGTGALLQSDASMEQIVQAIKAVAAGLTVFDSALNLQSAEQETLVEPLTPRETEVLQLLGDGLGNKDIAGKLNISEHTIKFHIRSILGKLGATSRTEAVARGLRSGLIEL
jgi:two-component system, NarL family, response regulator YdfI